MINRADTHILPVEFEYHAPASLGEAVKLLAEYGGEARVLAGGTDLLTLMKQGLAEPGHIVNVKMIPELKGIRDKGDGVFIGACTRLRELERSSLVAGRLPMLKETVETMASVQIRNMATVGGNLCNASPAADTATALIALGATAQIAGPSEEREAPIEEFFVGPGETILGRGELLVGVFVPYPGPGSGASFIKIGRTKLDISTVNVAVSIELEKGSISGTRIALGAVAPVPLRLVSAEEYLVRKRPSPEAFREAAKICCVSIKPIDDVRASADYRLAVSEALVQDALSSACGRAEGG